MEKARAEPDSVLGALTDLRGVGPQLAERLAAFGITTPFDLLYHFPYAYTDRSQVRDIAAIGAGEDVTIIGTVGSVRGGRRRGWRVLPVAATLTDESGSIAAVWFNQPYLAQSLRQGQRLMCTGRVREYRGSLQLGAPLIEILDAETDAHEAALLPRYRTPPGISERRIRQWMAHLLGRIPVLHDPLPEWIRTRWALPDWVQAMNQMHAPAHADDHAAARRRFVFEEFLSFQYLLQRARQQPAVDGVAPVLAAPDAVREFQSRLPFALTREQVRVWEDIRTRLGSTTPANLLLQGDVGTGKTLLALQAILTAVRAGSQAALMAPTEVLADQHAENVRRWLEPHGVVFTTLTGGLARRDRRLRLEGIAAGEIHLVVGTHALLEKRVQFRNLGLVLIDEQHRFGVLQRARLKDKGVGVHLLVLTATPIPRTLALTLYGDFDRLTLRERPADRREIVTEIVGDQPGKLWIDRVRGELDAGRQAFWVCPLVAASERSEGRDAVAATDQIALLRRGPLKAYHLDLLHGGMSSDDKSAAMRRFAAGETQVLVCTTVIEVGVDVPNATVMVIENADQFGLAQLHQLRGRLGRGPHPGLCLLRGTPSTTAGEERLRAMASTTDGFELAALDLSLRGPGEFLGVRQSGVPRLRFGHLIRDAGIMEEAAACARELLTRDPDLVADEHRGLGGLVADAERTEIHL